VSYIPALCKTGCPARSKRINPFWAVKLTGISAFERIDMTEYEQCMLMVLKDIKSQLNNVSDGLYSISKELKQMNEYKGEEIDWGYDMHKDLEKINDTFGKMYSLMDQRV
jgi:hypothetical protein